MVQVKLNSVLWLRLSIFNLFLVALLGTLMRYKIGFEFPYFNQKNLQHAHSHFAFAGWITHTLFVLMTDVLVRDRVVLNARKYNRLIVANLACAYGMLLSFSAQGYGGVSISFSCASIIVAYIFAFCFFKDLTQAGDKPYKNWFKAALWFNIISSVGTFTLGYMMATHNFNHKIQLGALYYYLHFQYNGFFMFACLGLLVSRFGKQIGSKSNAVFWMFFMSCIPAYFLSVLWAKLPLWLYTIVVAAAIVQVIAWIKFIIGVKRGLPAIDKPKRLVYYIMLIVASALSVKLLLQLGSTIPAVSDLAFGFRPIVIAYLHLILLAIISVFLVTYMYLFGYINNGRLATFGLVLFVIGVYLNELVLGGQGIASFSYTVIPKANEALFIIAAMILLSILLLLVSQSKWDNSGRKTTDSQVN